MRCSWAHFEWFFIGGPSEALPAFELRPSAFLRAEDRLFDSQSVTVCLVD